MIGLAFVVIGVAAAASLARARARTTGLAERDAVDGLFLMLASGLVAAHATGAVLYHWEELRQDLTVLLPGAGSACSLGAIAGAAVVGALWFRARAPGAVLAHADNLTLALSLGWGIGRIGCFLRHDHLGAETDFPLGVVVAGARRHDLGLYEALLAFGLFGVLFALDRRRGAPGRLVAVAAVLYGCGRVAIELLRADDLEALGRRSDPRFLGLTLVQWAAPLVVLAGALLLVRAARAGEADASAGSCPSRCARRPLDVGVVRLHEVALGRQADKSDQA